MAFKTLTTLGLAVAALGLIACGKNNNNLKIDGTYRYVETQYSDGVVEKPAGLSLLKIENNVGTHYDFSADGKGVEIYQTERTIQGRTLVSSKLLGEDKCADDGYNVQSEGLSRASNIQLSGKTLILAAEDVKIIYEVISEEDFKAAVEKTKIKGFKIGCLDEKASLVKTFEEVEATETVQSVEEAAATAEADELVKTTSSVNKILNVEDETAAKNKQDSSEEAVSEEVSTDE